MTIKSFFFSSVISAACMLYQPQPFVDARSICKLTNNIWIQWLLHVASWHIHCRETMLHTTSSENSFSIADNASLWNSRPHLMIAEILPSSFRLYLSADRIWVTWTIDSSGFDFLSEVGQHDPCKITFLVSVFLNLHQSSTSILSSILANINTKPICNAIWYDTVD